MAVLSWVAMSKVTPPGGAGVDRKTVKVKVVVPESPSFRVTSLIVKSVQFPKGVPSTFTPGENFRPPAPAALVCRMKFPLMSGARVSD